MMDGGERSLRLRVDEGFLIRVHKTTLWLGGVIFVLLCTTLNGKLVMNYAVGLGLGLGLLKAQELFADAWLGAETRTARRAALVGMAVKLGVPFVVLWLLHHFDYLHPIALLGGFVTRQAVIVLKIVGMMMVNRAADKQESRGSQR